MHIKVTCIDMLFLGLMHFCRCYVSIMTHLLKILFPDLINLFYNLIFNYFFKRSKLILFSSFFHTMGHSLFILWRSSVCRAHFFRWVWENVWCLNIVRMINWKLIKHSEEIYELLIDLLNNLQWKKCSEYVEKLDRNIF